MGLIQKATPETLGELAYKALAAEVSRGWAFQRFQALKNQREIAYRNSNTDRRAMDGVGQQEMSLDLDVYLHWTQREGTDFWKDKGNRKFIAQRYPQTRVKGAGTKAQVGWRTACQ